MVNITKTGLSKLDPDFFVNQDPDTDPGFMTKNLNIFIHKKQHFFSYRRPWRGSKLHETPPAVQKNNN